MAFIRVLGFSLGHTKRGQQLRVRMREDALRDLRSANRREIVPENKKVIFLKKRIKIAKMFGGSI